MTDSVEAYPLHWPEGWERTPRMRRVEANYKVTFDRARQDLRAELRRLGAQNVTLSTNIPLRKDGEPYANWREPGDPGVAVYWSVRRRKPAGGFYMQPQVVACDKWRKVRHNLPPDGEDVAARNVGAFIDRIRNEVLEEAVARCHAIAEDYTEDGAGEHSAAAGYCAHSIRALKHTEDGHG